MTKKETLLRSRLDDLAQSAWDRGIPYFTDFLSLNEQNIYHSCCLELSWIRTVLFGGYELAERQMLGFLPDAFYFDAETDREALFALFPIRCLAIRPVNIRFAEALTHRDYLGALMNLGTERSLLGDILVQNDQALLFCHERMAEYIRDNLTQVRRTQVSIDVKEAGMIEYAPKVEHISGTVSSVRLDALISLAFKSSRSSLSAQIEGGNCFVNGKQITSNGYHPKPGDRISVRGLGKFCYVGEGNRSKKGRLYVEIDKYI